MRAGRRVAVCALSAVEPAVPAALGVAAAVTIAALGLTTDVRRYGLLAGWLAVGMACYAWRRTRRATA